jgi:hypothetical protein
VPAVAVWEILTSREGARLWLDDDRHGGIEVGATVPVRGVGPAKVVAVHPGALIELRFEDGKTVSVEIRAKNDKSSELVIDDDSLASTPAVGWSHLLESARITTDIARDNRRPRQAILVIHGIGNQRPMSTARRFTDALVDRAERWSKPDRLSSSYELRRYQLARTTRRPRTDIYELYWADKVPGTVIAHILRWLKSQLLRRPRDVSPALRPVVYACAGVLALAAAAVIYLVATIGVDGVNGLWQETAGVAGLWIVGALVSGFLIKSVGDAARYLDDDPENIAVRQSIREAGVTLLGRLHTHESYDRIVIVGHSLGSIIAYDLIRQYWSEVHTQHGSPATVSQPTLKDYEANVDASTRDTQKALWEENRRLGIPWLITDLITLGSPLTHARSLLARSASDLEARKRDLELPACPPRPDGSGLTRRDDYVVDGKRRTIKLLTHGCPFAMTRWTNLYAPVKGVVFGDLIGGPVAPEFGAGVQDVPVAVSPWWRRRTLLAHTAYWRRTDSSAGFAVQDLLNAIDLDSKPWLDRHVEDLPWAMSLR